MATISVKKKIFFLVFCLASVCQGMYSTYFVSILTTIERLYQIQSKTAGAILSATEVGQIIGALLIAFYGGKGNKPKWIAACMTLTAIAALISTTPHFLLSTSKPLNTPLESMLEKPYLTSDLKTDLVSQDASIKSTHSLTSATSSLLSAQDQLCYLNNMDSFVLNSSQSLVSEGPAPTILATIRAPKVHSSHTPTRLAPVNSILVMFFLCLLAIGFGSTAITTLGIPYIDDIASKEESPLYLGLTIGLKIFGPALGFLLGSFCIRLNVNLLTLNPAINSTGDNLIHPPSNISSTMLNSDSLDGVGAWWLGLIIISLPLLILAIPMYFLSMLSNTNDPSTIGDLQDNTYQAAEDHDIGGSRDFQPHVLTVGELDVTSDRTFYSDIDSSSREVLQAKSSSSTKFDYNYVKNITLEKPLLTKESILEELNKEQLKLDENGEQNDSGEHWNRSCLVVNHFGELESINYAKDEAKRLHPAYPPSSSTSLSSDTSSKTRNKHLTMDLSGSLGRLLSNKLLLLRMFSSALHILPVAGFYTFLPKYLIEQFRIAPSSASAISGLAGILFVGLGAFLGGMFIRILNVNARFITRWIAAAALLYTIGMLILMNLGCHENQTVYYESNDFSITDCRTNCRCSSETYSPVCANGTTYMSPCLAGCKNYTVLEDKIIFDECGCNIRPTNSDTNDTEKVYLTDQRQQQQLNLNVATQGHCTPNCDNLKWYIIIFSLFTLIHASCEVGSVMLNLRCVKPNDRTLALGMITFTSSLLGTIPCSVIYGAVIDLTCIHWDMLEPYQMGVGSPATLVTETTTLTKGACRAYKNEAFRYYLHGVTAFVMFLAFIIDFIISKRAKGVNFYDDHENELDNEQTGKDLVTVESPLNKSTETI